MTSHEMYFKSSRLHTHIHPDGIQSSQSQDTTGVAVIVICFQRWWIWWRLILIITKSASETNPSESYPFIQVWNPSLLRSGIQIFSPFFLLGLIPLSLIPRSSHHHLTSLLTHQGFKIQHEFPGQKVVTNLCTSPRIVFTLENLEPYPWSLVASAPQHWWSISYTSGSAHRSCSALLVIPHARTPSSHPSVSLFQSRRKVKSLTTTGYSRIPVNSLAPDSPFNVLQTGTSAVSVI